MPAYQIALGIALIIIGAGLVCVASIWRHPQPAEPDDGGELRAFVDTLPPIDEEVDARPRIDRIRKKDSRERADDTEANLRPRIDLLRKEESLK
jgi:hypothetical protein